MGIASVLCHTFEHEGRWFCFDTQTSHIYECDEVGADVAPVWNQLADENVRRPLDDKWGRERVQASLEEIKALSAAEQALTPRELAIVHQCSCCGGAASAELYDSAIGHMQMTLTEQCNLRCEYCPYSHESIGTRVHNDTHMSRETALAAVDFFMARNHDTEKPAISFYGGEPLLRFDLMKEIVAHLRSVYGDRDVQLHVDTNGVLIDDEVASYLIEEEFFVQLSLDGPRHIHDRYRRTRGGQGSYDQVVAGLERLLRLDPQAHQRFRYSTVMAIPYEIKDVMEFFIHFPPHEKMNISAPPAVSMKFADLSGIDFKTRDCKDDSEQKYKDEYAEVRRQYMDGCLAGNHNNLPGPLRFFFDSDIVQYHDRSRLPLPDEFIPTGCCIPGQRKVHIKADGSFTVCERCGDNMIIGHVDSGFDMPMIHTLHEKMVTSVAERCKECWAIRNCALCFIHMADYWKADGTGDIMIPEELCQQVRDGVAQTLKVYLTLKNGGPNGLTWLKDTKLT